MRIFLMAIVFIFCGLNALAQNTNKISLVSATVDKTVLTLDFGDYALKDVLTPRGAQQVPIVQDASMLLQKGAPDLPVFTEAILIPNNKKMALEVLVADFVELKNIEIAPSKGGIKRTVLRRAVPYTYGPIYSSDAFFPQNIAWLTRPYILRNSRALTVKISPFQYNSITKTLRIYKNIKLRIYATQMDAEINPLIERLNVKDGEFNEVYKNRFLNYQQAKIDNRPEYTVLDEGHPGRMLVISYPGFLNAIQPLIDWKNQKGIHTDLVDVTTIGGKDSVQIKAYIQNYYNTHPDFAYLLLVGDVDQLVPSHTIPDSWGESYGGNCDNAYGFLAGNDHYVDIFVGRFSGNTVADIRTQVERTLHYEKHIKASETWMTNALLSASQEDGSSSGEIPDDGEPDSTHLNNIIPDLLGYGYSIFKEYEIGGSAQGMQSVLNKGCGQFQYTGHGSTQGLGNVPYVKVFVDNLRNRNKLPFLNLVGCSTGNYFDQSCFSERFLRATHQGQATGVIATAGSIIAQYWAAPMDAQDEIVDILVESYSHNIKRTYGGVSFNGFFHMMDEYNTIGDTPGLTYGEEMADYWVIFGDPSVMLRTQLQSDMRISHAAGINSGAASFVVNCDADDALLCLSHNDHILGIGFASGGTATIILNTPLVPTSGTLLLTATAYNKVTYQRQLFINVQNAPQADFVTNTDTIGVESPIIFQDKSSHAPTSWAWTFAGGTPATSTAQNPSVSYTSPGTYSVQLTATNAAGSHTKSKTAYITVETHTLCRPSIISPSSTEYISRVKLNNLDNRSTINGGYSDFTSLSADATVGDTYVIYIEDVIDPIYMTLQHVIWIDWNENGSFYDDNELIYASPVGDNESLKTREDTVWFRVPPNTQPGYKRLRIRLHDRASEQNLPCGESMYGEVEDYFIHVSSFATGVSKLEDAFEVSVYPNPSSGIFNVRAEEIAMIKVFDLSGKYLFAKKARGGEAQLDLSHYAPGIYVLGVFDGKGEAQFQKVVRR